MSFSLDARVRPPAEPPAGDLGPFPTLPAPPEQKNLLTYLRLIWEQRRMLSRVAAVALAGSIVLALVIPARYTATTRLMPPDNQSGSGMALAAVAAMSQSTSSGGEGLSGIASNLLGLKSNSDVFVGILGSRTVRDNLIQQFNLKHVYWDRRMEDARNDLADRTDVSIDRKSQIITIRVSDRDPQRATAMAQAYVDELNRLVAELSTSSARRERIFLEGRLKSVSQDLESAETDFSQYASKNTTIDVKEQGKAMVEAAATLQGELIAAQSEYEGLKQIYTDGNVRVRSLRARMDELKNQLQKLGGKGGTTADLANDTSNDLYPSIRKLPLLGVQFADLYRRTKIQEAVLETLTKEYEMAKVQEAKEIPTVKVLDAAVVPERKSFPPRTVIVICCTMLCMGLAAAWVCAKAGWDQLASSDPRKAFATEVFQSAKSEFHTLKSHLPWTSRNGHSPGGPPDETASRFRRNGHEDESDRES